MTGLHNYQASLQEHHQHFLGQLDNNHPVMDELLDQIFSLPTWSDVGGGLGKVAWDNHTGGLGANPGLDSSGALQGAHKLFTMSLLPPGLLNGAFHDRGLGSQERENQDTIKNQQLEESNQYYNNDIDFLSRPQEQQEIQGSEQAQVGGPAGSLTFNDNTTLNLVSQTIGSSQGGSGVRPVNPLPPLRLMNGRGSLQLNSLSSVVSNGSPLPLLTPGSNLQNVAMLPQSSSGRSSGSEGSAEAHHSLSPPPIAHVIRQPYVGGSSPLPFALGQHNPVNLLEAGETSGDAFLGKRSRREEVPLKEHQPNQGRHGLFDTLTGGQDHLPTTQGIVSATYGPAAAAAAQVHGPGPAVPVTGFNGARPRVRARRGQATDPHSIAERLRRERIAERMKSLQELVPNSNKTDKASMLDEIIDYVKFLQLQVKVLSISRLGGAGAVAQVINDLPSEGPNALLAATLGPSNATSGPPSDGLALTEHQVARLMEDDMGTAMQYLQSKGLCLMPISLASAISSSGTKSKAINQGSSGVTCDDKAQSQTQAVMIPVSLAMAGRATSFTGVNLGDGRISESDSGTKVGSDGVKQVKGCIELNLGEMSNSFRDVTASRSPKSSAVDFQRQSQ